jgi:RNA polymerase sigma factor (sigma-70 family)
MEQDAANLRDEYLRALAKGSSAEELWRIFAEDSWYQHELRLCARLALRQWRAPPDWLGDVVSLSLVIFAEKLKRTPHLHLDPQAAERTFAAWLRQLMSRDCLEAIRQWQRTTPPQRELWPHDWISTGEMRILAEQIDLAFLLERLPQPEQDIVSLFLQGYRRNEIAQHAKMPYGRVRRGLQRGLRQLRRLLDEHWS